MGLPVPGTQRCPVGTLSLARGHLRDGTLLPCPAAACVCPHPHPCRRRGMRGPPRQPVAVPTARRSAMGPVSLRAVLESPTLTGSLLPGSVRYGDSCVTWAQAGNGDAGARPQGNGSTGACQCQALLRQLQGLRRCHHVVCWYLGGEVSGSRGTASATAVLSRLQGVGAIPQRQRGVQVVAAPGLGQSGMGVLVLQPPPPRTPLQGAGLPSCRSPPGCRCPMPMGLRDVPLAVPCAELRLLLLG